MTWVCARGEGDQDRDNDKNDDDDDAGVPCEADQRLFVRLSTYIAAYVHTEVGE